MLMLYTVFPALLASVLAMPGSNHEAFIKQMLSHSLPYPELSQAMVTNVGSNTCEIELHVTEKIKGQCIQLGNSIDRGCMAGMYFEPFHIECNEN